MTCLTDSLPAHGGAENLDPARFDPETSIRAEPWHAPPVTLVQHAARAAAWTAGTVLHPAGAVAAAGLLVGSILTTGSPAAGARIADGLLWGAGPENSLLALAASGVAATTSRERAVTTAEHGWAAEELLGDALPPRERLVLTDALGAGGRAFVFPRWDGAITVNVGPELFEDPVRADPHTFLHELVHTCQVRHASSRRAFTSAAVVTQVRHSLGRDAYAYDLPVRPLAAYGMEQQAQLAADWWRGRPGRRGRPTALRGHTRRPRDPASPWAACVADLRAARF